MTQLLNFFASLEISRNGFGAPFLVWGIFIVLVISIFTIGFTSGFFSAFYFGIFNLVAAIIFFFSANQVTAAVKDLYQNDVSQFFNTPFLGSNQSTTILFASELIKPIYLVILFIAMNLVLSFAYYLPIKTKINKSKKTWTLKMLLKRHLWNSKTGNTIQLPLGFDIHQSVVIPLNYGDQEVNFLKQPSATVKYLSRFSGGIIFLILCAPLFFGLTSIAFDVFGDQFSNTLIGENTTQFFRLGNQSIDKFKHFLFLDPSLESRGVSLAYLSIFQSWGSQNNSQFFNALSNVINNNTENITGTLNSLDFISVDRSLTLLASSALTQPYLQSIVAYSFTNAGFNTATNPITEQLLTNITNFKNSANITTALFDINASQIVDPGVRETVNSVLAQSFANLHYAADSNTDNSLATNLMNAFFALR
ncbi:hypothetical protein [[Mycoplasma] testudinis]|uniref:hypothetical protein n=1 Tax=[Mycoplasma] testudinis TaxID=33924 RepID=UPI000484E6B2|nr:hypothetical protein [[Mycoplasma] testudinis]